MTDTLRIAVLLSGTGRTLENLLQRILAESLPIEVVAVASNKKRCRGLDIAQHAGLPNARFPLSEHADAEQRDQAMLAWCGRQRPALLVLAGYTAHLDLGSRPELPVVNIHPSLLPEFGGQGYYGHRVHQAVLQAGRETSGCTVHRVDSEFDRGPILAQRSVPVVADDTVESLAARVFEAECELYPAVLCAMATGDIPLHAEESGQ